MDFAGEGDRVRYVIQTGGAGGPFEIDVALRFQPIGFRWAANLQTYDAPEPRRFVRYYQEMSDSSSTWLTRATARVGASVPGAALMPDHLNRAWRQKTHA